MYQVIWALNLLLECLVNSHVVFSCHVVRGCYYFLHAVMHSVMADDEWQQMVNILMSEYYCNVTLNLNIFAMMSHKT